MRNEAMLSLLKTLMFNGMLSQFDEIMEASEITKLNGIELMQQFLETEIAYRQTRSLRYHLDMARLPQVKSLDNFDCHELPIQKEQLITLADCQFIIEKSNLLLIGGSGSGKTHIYFSHCLCCIAEAIACEILFVWRFGTTSIAS